MYRHVHWRIVFITWIITSVLGCGIDDETYEDKNELGNAKPEVVPLVFSTEKKLLWDTLKGKLNPDVKTLDIEKLPAVTFDSAAPVPFSTLPTVQQFDFNSLPATNIDLEKLPDQDLELKFSALPPENNRVVSAPQYVPGRAFAVHDFGPHQGFNSNFVAALHTDNKGLLWMGGQTGLSTYDGINLRSIVEETNLHGNIISGLTPDLIGNIWFTTTGAGVSVVDVKRGTIGYSEKILAPDNNLSKIMTDSSGRIWLYNFKDSALAIIDPLKHSFKRLDQKSGLSNKLAFQVAEDKQHRLWISTYTTGVNIIDPVSGKIRSLRKVNGLSSDSISAITVDQEGRVWLSELNGLNVVDNKHGTITHYGPKQGLARNGFNFCLFCDGAGNLWRSGRYPPDTKFEQLNIKDGVVTTFRRQEGILGGVVLDFVQDNYNRVWVGSNGGLQRVDQGGKISHALDDLQVTSQIEDQNGNYWIATNNGATIINPRLNTKRTIQANNGLVSNFLQSFGLLGTKLGIASNGGVSIIDPDAHTITNFSQKHGLPNDTIYSIIQDKTGLLWLTSPSGGVCVIDFSNKTIRKTHYSNGLSDDNIQDVKIDKDGRIWLATNKHGVDVYDPNTGMIKNLYSQPGLTDTCNRMLVADDAGRMWIGTDKGIYVADIKQGTLTSINRAQGLSVNAVISLLKYENKIVAGARNKVNVITAPATGEKDGHWDISILEGSQGLVKQNNSWASDMITRSGDYMWGDQGISIIHGIRPARDSAITYVTGIKILNKQQRFYDKSNRSDSGQIKEGQNDYTWDSITGPYNLPVNFTVPYQDNYMQFQFGQANYGRQDSVFFSYFLEGVDKNWSEPSVNTFTENYLNLPPGKYTFKVNSKGVDSRWGVPASFSFTISPPWYKTWWAYLIYVLAAIAVLRGYIVYRSRRLKKENKLLEEKVQLRTKQLQQSIEELKTTQAQLIQSEKMASLGELTAGIAHEIQNPLNFVNNFSEINTELLQELKQERAKDKSERNEDDENDLLEDITQNMEKIAHHGKRADGIVKGMLQHSRSSSSVKELTDINKLADEYFRLAYHGLRAKDKSFNATMKADFDEDNGHINVVPQDMGRVILNLITNAFYAVRERKKRISNSGETHPSDNNYEPTVSVSIKRKNAKVLVEVEDNGDGVPQKVLDKIFQPFFTTKPTGQGTGLGLSLSYDIVKAHGGELKVETEEHQFARFTIMLPA